MTTIQRIVKPTGIQTDIPACKHSVTNLGIVKNREIGEQTYRHASI